MRRLIIAFMLVAAGLLVSAQGQTFSGEMTATSQGRGTLRMQGQRDEQLSRASVYLRRNGDVEIRVYSIAPTTLFGRWSGGRNLEVEIEIEEAFNETGASGRGRISLGRDGGFEKIDISGEARGRRYSVYFESDESSRGGTIGQSNEYAGTYRSSVSSKLGRDEYRIVRILRILQDGTAQLTSRYRGVEPPVGRDAIRQHGSLLLDIQRKRKIYHTGSWRTSGRRLEVSLTTLDDREKVQCRIVLETRGSDRNSLYTVYWDRNLYGSSGFEFKRIEESSAEDDDRYPGGDDINIHQRGNGTWTLEGRRNQNISSVSVIRRSNDIDITVAFSGGNRVVLTGRLERRDSYTIRVRLTGADTYDAEGIINIEQGSNNSINRLEGEGRIDGQRFSIRFSR